MYYKVAEQISKENAYSVTDRENQEDSSIYCLTKFQHGDIRFKVQFWPINKEFKCTCLLFETIGYPCRHIWAVMKHLDIRIIPTSLILPRWCKDAKTSSANFSTPQADDNQRLLVEMSRYGSLNSDANLMNFYASKVESSFKLAKDEIARLTTLFKDMFENMPTQNEDSQGPVRGHRHNPNIIRDPRIVKTKGSGNQTGRRDGVPMEGPIGTVRRPRICNICKGVGHDARNCLQRPRVPRNRAGPSSSHTASNPGEGSVSQYDYMDDHSTQDSFHSIDFM